MKSRYIVTLAALCSCWSLAAHADRDTGWEFGGELIYQTSQDISGDNGSTAALDDAGQRLGRLFLTQLILNATFGVVIGLGLAIIGVPSSPLWGLLAMILRFVPYIGAILAAGLPIALAAAVGSDWTMTLWTVALFAVVEPLTGHVVEPLELVDLALGDRKSGLILVLLEIKSAA